VIPEVDAWDAWRPSAVAERLAGLEAPWCVAAGWALDLFLGAETRPHSDLEVAVPAAAFDAVAARFADCDFYVPRDGRLAPLDDELLRAEHQTWACERATGKWRVDVFREPHDGDTWICRRNPEIRRPYRDIIRHTADGIPYLTPEVVLLFKAKHGRDKDEADFARVRPLLDQVRRRWLDGALALTHPAHPWRAALH
jgi:hypothetical protein